MMDKSWSNLPLWSLCENNFHLDNISIFNLLHPNYEGKLQVATEVLGQLCIVFQGVQKTSLIVYNPILCISYY